MLQYGKIETFCVPRLPPHLFLVGVRLDFPRSRFEAPNPPPPITTTPPLPVINDRSLRSAFSDKYIRPIKEKASIKGKRFETRGCYRISEQHFPFVELL